MKKHLLVRAVARPAPARSLRWSWLGAMLLSTSCAAALLALVALQPAHAQLTASATAPGAEQQAPAAPAAPKYAVQDVERVFNYLDANRDGKISREEAAAFKNIARHFDGADTNRDGYLSRDEFGYAVNGGKAQ